MGETGVVMLKSRVDGLTISIRTNASDYCTIARLNSFLTRLEKLMDF